jgi:hypothetical protein
MARPKELLPMSQLKNNLPALNLLQGLIVEAMANTALAKEATTDYRLARYEILSSFQRSVNTALNKMAAPESRSKNPIPPLL